MKLEELARQSSHDARVSVAHLDLPPIGDERRNRSWTPILAAAGVAAAVVAGLVVVTQFNGGDEAASDDVLPPVVDVPHLALPPDSGWTITVVTSAEDFIGLRGLDRPTFTYYGTTGATDPFADGDLLIATYVAPEDAESSLPPEGETVELRGTTGSTSAGVDAGLPADSVSLEWIERDAAGNALHVILVSQRLDGERLLAIAEDLAIDVEGAAVTPGDDLGLERLASAPGTPFDAFATSPEGSLIGYERGAEFLVLSTGRGDVDRQALILRWWMPEVTATTIDGRPGYVAAPSTSMEGVGRPLVWAPADGIVANLTYFGPANLDLVSIAESVVDLDDAAWDALVVEFTPSQTGADQLDEVYAEGTGSFDDVDYAWALGVQGTDLCFHLSEGPGSSGSCQPRADIVPPPGAAVTIDNSFGDRIGNVVIAADPTVDDIVETEGRYTIDRFEADGVSWFVAVGDATVQPTFDVIRNGATVAVLDAAVGATESYQFGGLVDPAIIEELGLEDLEVVLATEHTSESWFLGVRDDEQCLVVAVDGRGDVICQPLADIAVFGPFEVPDGDRSFVSAIVPPECADQVRVDGVDLPFGATAGGTHMVWTVAGSTAGATMTIDGGVDGPATVDLPTPSGTASFPADPCGG